MRVRLHNVGPIRDGDIELRPLTVLVGPNGSGKTTFTSVTYACLLAHAQATRDAFELVDNPFGSARGDRGRPLTGAIVDRWQNAFVERLDFELRRCCGPDLSALGRARRGGKGAGPRIEVASNRWCLPFRLEDDSVSLETTAKSFRRVRLRVPRNADARKARTLIGDALRGDMPRRAIYFPAGRSGFVQTHTAMSGLVLSALSGGYFQDATLGAIPGATADFMRLVAQLSAKGRTKATAGVAKQLETRLLRGKVRLLDEGSARQLLFMPEGQKAEWPIQNMATAVSEFASLILYLRHVAQTGDALLIDEPESHLHPSSQVELANALGELSRVLPPVVVATHSEFLVSALSNLLLRDQSEGKEPPALGVYGFSFHSEDRGLGADVQELPVAPEEGFEIEQFSEIANQVFNESISLYNDLHVAKS